MQRWRCALSSLPRLGATSSRWRRLQPLFTGYQACKVTTAASLVLPAHYEDPLDGLRLPSLGDRDKIHAWLSLLEPYLPRSLRSEDAEKYSPAKKSGSAVSFIILEAGRHQHDLLGQSCPSKPRSNVAQ